MMSALLPRVSLLTAPRPRGDRRRKACPRQLDTIAAAQCVIRSRGAFSSSTRVTPTPSAQRSAPSLETGSMEMDRVLKAVL
mmetsp:Transcript_57808/g.122606  ORF Transcript_57808/g.122606 Transcript_57808/m.122606 type:complete len:81 (-) Transcript_57808:72-314(-)